MLDHTVTIKYQEQNALVKTSHHFQGLKLKSFKGSQNDMFKFKNTGRIHTFKQRPKTIKGE